MIPDEAYKKLIEAQAEFIRNLLKLIEIQKGDNK